MRICTETPAAGSSGKVAVAVGPDQRDGWCCHFSSNWSDGTLEVEMVFRAFALLALGSIAWGKIKAPHFGDSDNYEYLAFPPPSLLTYFHRITLLPRGGWSPLV